MSCPVRILVLVSACLLSSCALMSEARYLPPQAHQADFVRTYPCSFEKTWAAAISSLSGKSFVLDSVSKDSGIITFSFVSPDPGEYLDCGRLD